MSYIFETLSKYVINKIAVKHIRITSLKLLPINKRIVVLASADKEQNWLLDRNWVGGNNVSPSWQIVYTRYSFIVYTIDVISRTHL